MIFLIGHDKTENGTVSSNLELIDASLDPYNSSYEQISQNGRNIIQPKSSK